KGNIVVEGNYQVGMKISGRNTNLNTDITNTNRIIVKNQNAIGMVARDNSNIATNNNGSNINIDGKYSFGMYGNGHMIGDRLTNNGTITLKGNDQVGMYADNGSKAINHGNINLDGSNGVGMWANGNGSEVTNKGTITLRGTGTDINDSTNTNDDKYPGNRELGKDNHGNIGMKATAGGKIINKGKIIFNNQ
ncbi:MAG: hypothetical protein KAH04_07250, partial [Psychrilyobacter sp.]|nr:hypothetical protein [Psychrilyobacter sp.]